MSHVFKGAGREFVLFMCVLGGADDAGKCECDLFMHRFAQACTHPRCARLGVHGDRRTDRDMHVNVNTHSTHLQDSAPCRPLHNARHTVSMI